MTFREALVAGQTEYGTPEKVATTFVSQVCIFKEKVLKVYKHEEFFFADLKGFKSRKAFYEEDFFWNNNASPEIYLHLWGIKEQDGVYELVPPSMGEDFVIEMSRIDDSFLLTKILQRGELTADQAEGFVVSLVDTLATLTRERRSKLDHLFQRGLYSIMVENTKSLHDWMLSEEQFDTNVAQDIADTLYEGLEKIPYFKEYPNEELSAAIDVNCDNLILLDGKPSYIDILSPMEVWRVVDEYASIARPITHIEAIQGLEMGKVARDAYAKFGRNIPKAAMLMHEVRGSAIQWPYRYMLGQPDLAKKFEKYTLQKLEELKAELR